MAKIMKNLEDFDNLLSKEPWNKIHGKAWKRSVKIGEGTYGSVHIGQREDMRIFAVKSAELLGSSSDSKIISNLVCLQNEIITLSQLRCKYIIRMLGCGRSDGKNSYKTDEQPMLDLFLEFIPRGSLHHLMRRLQLGATTATTDLHCSSTVPTYGSTSSEVEANERRLKRLPEFYVRAYTHDILRAVDYIHRKQFVHGDIKPLNLLVAGDCLKLADFGGSKTLKKKRLDCWATRTAKYSAPEVFYKIEQGFASDVFSVGCCVLEMTAGFVPDPLFIPQWLSQQGQNFLRRCLTCDPSKRWTAAQLLDHPFIRDRDQDDTRPYSTIVPTVASNMILQPPPTELYTNTMFSPTWQGDELFLPHADPKVIHKRIHEENTHPFRKEQITISSGRSPPPPPSQTIDLDDDDTETSTGASTRDSSNSTDYFSILISMIPAVSRIVARPAPTPTTTKAKAKAKANPVAASQPQPKPSARTDPKSMHGDSSNTPSRTTVSLPSDSSSEEYKSILPDYKPEFELPEDNSLHFLLPGTRPATEKNKNDNLDAQAPALLKETPKKMQIRPPPLVISDKPTDFKSRARRNKPESPPKYFTLPLPTSNGPSEQELKPELHEGHPNFLPYNEEIKQEARAAEAAGIYDNKLCPRANDEEKDPRILFPTLASSTRYKPYISCFVNILKGYKTCQDVDSVHMPNSYNSAKEGAN